MQAPANIRPIARANATSFKPGQSGNPRGRTPGTQRKVTIEARVAASRIVDDPKYREQLLQRMIDGTAGAMEALMWFYAKGKPQEHTEVDGPSAFAGLSNEDLRRGL